MTRFHWLMLSAAAAVVTVWTVGSHDAQGLAQDRASPRSTGSVPVADRQVVVEFFTSQGCSSCPPSDHLAARLATEPGVLVMQRPVTYWDRLGWTDTLGKEGNTSLQRSYAARRLGGRNGVYTPQAVIGGKTLRYTNIWKGEKPLGGQGAIEKGVTLGPSDLTIDGADRYAVVVRQGPGGPITGAAMLR